MKRLLNLGFVVVALALIAFATTLRSPSDDRSDFTTGSASAKKSMTVAGANKLPVEEYEDMSLVFSTPTKH
jgi:hypothetical protein